MKPKTIRDKIRELVFDYSKPDGLNLGDTTDAILAQIQQLLEECAPEEIEEGDGWDIYFSQSDTLGMGGKVRKKGKARSCCPGDDIAYAHNQAISQYKSNLMEKLR